MNMVRIALGCMLLAMNGVIFGAEQDADGGESALYRKKVKNQLLRALCDPSNQLLSFDIGSGGKKHGRLAESQDLGAKGNGIHFLFKQEEYHSLHARADGDHVKLLDRFVYKRQEITQPEVKFAELSFSMSKAFFVRYVNAYIRLMCSWMESKEERLVWEKRRHVLTSLQYENLTHEKKKHIIEDAGIKTS